jgi:hypothetical protein
MKLKSEMMRQLTFLEISDKPIKSFALLLVRLMPSQLASKG